MIYIQETSFASSERSMWNQFVGPNFFLDKHFKEYFWHKSSWDFYVFLFEVAYIRASFWMKQISEKILFLSWFLALRFLKSWSPFFCVFCVLRSHQKLLYSFLTTVVAGYICLLSNLFKKTSDFVNNWHICIN